MAPFLFAALLVLGLVPLLPALPRRRKWTILGGFWIAGWSVAYTVHTALGPNDLRLRPVQQRHDEYLGSGSCRACHADQYRSWHASYHRTMTQVPGAEHSDRESVRAPFDGRTVRIDGRSYRFYRKGSSYWVEYDDQYYEEVSGTPGGAREPVVRSQRVQRRIVLVTGSHHYQVYWFSPHGTRLLAHLPVVYLLDEQRWIPRHASFVVPTECSQDAYLMAKGTGAWNMGCIRCHATHGRPKPVVDPDDPLGLVEEMETDVAEFGIACEACHGPGEIHTRANRDYWRRRQMYDSDQPDPTIRNPERMSHRRSTEVCGQCHAVQYFADRERSESFSREGYTYRPGDVLAESRLVIALDQDRHPMLSELLRDYPNYLRNSFWPDGMVRITGRELNSLQNTPCYQRGEMSCLSCHEMHPEMREPSELRSWAHGQLRTGADGNQACLQCHQQLGQDISAHTHHAADSSGSQCYNCHMPHTAYGLLKGIRSHQITNPDVQVTLATGRPNACNLCHLDQTLAWTGEHLRQWYGKEEVELPPEHREIAASLVWLLQGHAGQRVLVASRMAWQPAREVAGTAWMAPFAAHLLNDEYLALRLVGERTLRTLPGFDSFTYDFLGPEPGREAAVRGALETWLTQRDPAVAWPSRLLLDATGQIQQQRVQHLLRTRDRTPLSLAE